jgi:hypothetical protein
MPEYQRPDQVLFVIITDGEENSSRKYRRADVRDRITHQQNKYKWQFVFLGANQDALKEAESYGIDHNHALAYAADITHTHNAWRGLTNTTMNYVSSTGLSRNNANNLNFTEDIRSEAKDPNGSV